MSERGQLPPGPPPGSASPLPGHDATDPPHRRLLLPGIAAGCALLLLLGIVGVLGTARLWGGDDDRTAASDGAASDTTADGPDVWRPLEEGQEPTGSADELAAVLAQNPLLEARLEQPARCALPSAGDGAVPADELQGYLEAGADCLGASWSAALGAVGLEFEPPDVVVYTVEALPEESACDPERFSEAAPVVCQGDNTLYWPEVWDPGFSNAAAAEVPQLYMWHLSYSYTLFAMGSASLDGYFGALLIALADDPGRAEESQRRYGLQVSCLASAAAHRQPDGIRPEGRVEDFVTSVEAQAAPATDGEPSPEARADWVGIGRDSEGVLAECNTWTADVDAIDVDAD
jgi:hypothetical protein